MDSILFDHWRLLPDSGELSRDGKTVRLQDQSLEVLRALLERPGHLITREELIARLWPQVVVDYDTSLKSIIRKLRIALDDDAEQPRYIETLPRKGYRFIGNVGAPAKANLDIEKTVRPPRFGQRATLVGFIAVGVLALVAIPLGTMMQRAQVASQTSKLRIAVLPFENLSPDAANAFFTDGVHEEIISTLAARAGDMEVVPRTTMMAYRSASDPIGQAASDLGATHVMAGSVRREGQDVRLTTQLVDARTHKHVWSKTFNRSLASSLTLQSEIADAVATQLAVSLAKGHAPSVAPSNPDAYDAYLKSRLAFRDGDWSDAVAMASQAIERDPKFGAAYVVRAAALNMQIVWNLSTTEATLRAQYEDTQSARSLLGDNDPLVLGIRAFHASVGERDHQASLSLFAAAEAAGLKDPALLRTRAMQYVVIDRLDDAIAAHQSLSALDPGNFVLLNNTAILLSLAHRFDEAARINMLIVDRFSANPLGKLTQARLKFAHTGQSDGWLQAYETTLLKLDVDRRLLEQFDLFRYAGKLTELKQALDTAQDATVSAGTYNSLPVCCVGTRPVEEYRGWTALLLRDMAAAQRAGQSVLGHASREEPTRWNDWYLPLLQAEGLLMTGNKSEAILKARESLALVPRTKNAVHWRYAAGIAARVFAWSGNGDEAANLLEQLDRARPGLSPAEISRDPLYSIPLAKNERYLSLTKKLEAEIATHQ